MWGQTDEEEADEEEGKRKRGTQRDAAWVRLATVVEYFEMKYLK